ncbi:MAG: M1 family aminopeptidase [Candidatus Bipolaricaulia bacterium]
MAESRHHLISIIAIVTVFIVFLSSIIPIFAEGAETNYRIDAKLLEESQLIKGVERIEFTNTLDRPVSEIVLTLKANLHRKPNPYLSKVNIDQNYPAGFDPGWTKVTKVTGSDGEELNYSTDSLPPFSQIYSLKNTILRVELANKLEPGERTSVSLQFSTKFPRKKSGDEEYFQGVYTWRFGWYPTLTPPEWWKGYDRELYSQIKLPTADYDVQLNVPEDFSIAGTTSHGDPIENSQRKLFELELDKARSFPLIASSKYRRHRVRFKEFTIEVLHFPGYQEEARVLASYANDILKFYSERFGKYRRKKLTFTQNPVSGYFGMAADGVISLGNSFFEEKDLAFSTITNRLAEYMVAHEIAHQWFGIGVGANLNSQNWISEAFSEYLALQYFHHKYREFKPNLFRFERDGLIRNAIESQLGYINLRTHTFELPYILNFQKGFDEAIIKPLDEVKYASTYQTRVYKKGYMVLRTLEGIIGKSDMDKFLKRVYEKYKTDVIDVKILRSIAKKFGGGKIPDNFFQEWLFTSGHVNYGIEGFSSKELNSGSYSSEVVVTKSGTLNAPVELQATLSSGKKVLKTISVRTTSKTVTWQTETRIKKVTVDPKNKVMDTNRLNNHFPRKVEISLGKNALPLDAYFILVGPGTITGRTPNKYIWSLGPGYARGKANLSRNLSLSGGISLQGSSLSELNVSGWVESRFDFWSNPETGSASQYWSQNRSLNLGLERLTGQEDRAYNLLEIGASLSQTVTDNWYLDFRSTLSLAGDVKFSLSARETKRILPNIYLDFSSNLGFGLGNLPPLLKFDLSELKSYGQWRANTSGNLGWTGYSYPGNYKLFSKASLSFPISKDEKLFVGNLALITRVTQSLFVSGGATWQSLEEINPDDLHYEGGGKLSIQGKTLGGLVPFDLAIGYAYHGQDKGRPFFNFSLGF